MIDAHHHIWLRSRGDYHWLENAPAILQPDYKTDDLRPLLKSCGVEKTVLVQAAETTDETLYILNVAARTDFVAGVVGWLDFDDPDFETLLEDYARYPKFVGIRPVLQGIEEDGWILAPHRLNVLRKICELDLTFDALVQPRHLNILAQVLELVPDLRMVIDHGAKPLIAKGVIEPWAEQMKKLSQNRNLYGKLSGLANEAGKDWEPKDLEPYIDCLMQTFGVDRLMWGSDWPVVNAASSYADWHALARSFVEPYGPEAVNKVFQENAKEFYRLT